MNTYFFAGINNKTLVYSISGPIIFSLEANI